MTIYDMKIEPYFERPDVTIISDENFEEFIDLDADAVAVSCAEGGAMGSPGEVEIVTRDGKWYKTNYAFGTISVTNLFHVVPMLKRHNVEQIGEDAYKDNWRPYDLGAGNHLFIKTDIVEKFNILISDVTSPSQLYRRWPHSVNNILRSDK